jgi:hypothetical protein
MRRRPSPARARGARPTAILWLLVGLGLTGCPGTLQDPERFGAGRCELDVEADIFATSCAIASCHDSTTAALGLDLSGPGAGARLVGVPAATTAEDPTAECEGEGPYIDPSDLESSLLLDKVGRTPRCGGPMPYGSRGLSADQVACLREYIVAAASGVDGGTGGADAGSGGDAGVAVDGGTAGADAGADGGM